MLKFKYKCKPGSFLALKDAFVIARLAKALAGLGLVGDNATLIPIGPSLGCPLGLYNSEFLIAFVTYIVSRAHCNIV